MQTPAVKAAQAAPAAPAAAQDPPTQSLPAAAPAPLPYTDDPDSGSSLELTILAMQSNILAMQSNKKKKDSGHAIGSAPLGKPHC